MATNLSLNGSVYDGTPTAPAHPFKPDRISATPTKIGTVVIAANGTRTLVLRATKYTWAIGWRTTNETTRAAVRALHALSTSWAFVDQLGASYTVQTEATDYAEAAVRTDPAGAVYYDLDLTIRQV